MLTNQNEVDTIFDTISLEYVRSERLRTKFIQECRDGLKQSKAVIYRIQNDKFEEAKKLVSKLKEFYKELHLKFDSAENPSSLANMFSAFQQEYCEAMLFYYYITENKLLSPTELHISHNDYLLGISDLTGELVRKALLSSINKNYESVSQIRDFVNYLYGHFSKIDLRNGELRKKYDSIRWNLNKLENILYDLSLKD